jgi:hypothetical protein
VVFCIHGNKFGVANCCEDLWPISGSGHAHVANDVNHVVDDKAPLISSDDDEGRHQQDRQNSQDAGNECCFFGNNLIEKKLSKSCSRIWSQMFHQASWVGKIWYEEGGGFFQINFFDNFLI